LTEKDVEVVLMSELINFVAAKIKEKILV